MMEGMNEGRTQVVTLTMANGQTVRAEATVLGGAEDVADIAKALPFQQVADTTRSIAEGMLTAIRDANPDKATVEFGIQIAVESGALTALLVKGTGTANLKMSLQWGK